MVLPAPTLQPAPLLAILADLYTPLLALTFLCRLTKAPHARRRVLIYSVLINVAIAWGIKFVDIYFGIWPGWSLDYSTHTAVALALVISLSFGAPYQSTFWLASLLAYGWLMVSLGYHSVADIATTALATGVVMMSAGLWLYRSRRKNTGLE